ncbi:MAG: ATP-binding protein [Desulfuromonadaceae bacterium]|nr:ATP-binding protein [Desulfuromonadaceae bacterium]MDD2848127.1 ATP-binding protein [Desulfuromonadaceae bacterium]MDD4132032.1 ATP-binding protein [Desulfuromonadaceae bacterium]
MKLGVAHKLFLVILTASGLAVVSSALIMQWSLNRGFIKFINAMEETGISRLAVSIEKSYGTEQSWEFLRRDPARWSQLVAASLPEAPPPLPEERMPDRQRPEHVSDSTPRPMPPHLALHFDQRLFLLDANRKALVDHGAVPLDNAVTPLLYQGKTVGYLGLLPRTNTLDTPQRRFLREQKSAFALVAAAVVLLSSILSFLLARRLVRPLNVLAHATHQLAAGSFTARVPVTSHDELGQLACDFNSLALALEKSELARRQWVADISHELRTPLTILRGEIEALQDGIRQPTHETINSLHDEVQRLGRLVDDLYQLSLSDVGALTYRKTELDLTKLLAEIIALYRLEFLSKDILLDALLPENVSVVVFGDRERLHQLFSNLLDNALKYTDAGGRLTVTLQRTDNSAVVDFKDSAPHVPPSELGRLFERLYRVESSRNRSTGGAGLGLAICRNIVEAHGGNITAEASPLGGLWIRTEIPVRGS